MGGILGPVPGPELALLVGPKAGWWGQWVLLGLSWSSNCCCEVLIIPIEVFMFSGISDLTYL